MTSRTIKSTSLATLCATALSVGATAASAQFAGFNAATILSAELLADKPSSVVIGDYDGDGHNDLAVTYTGTNRVAIFFNNNDGTFMQPPTIVNNVGLLPGSIVTGDLDQDTDLDLATANANGGNVSILKNDGLGVFTNFGVFTAGAGPQSMAIGSLNGNPAMLDLVVGNTTQSSNGSFSVLLNNGGGVFTALSPLAITNQPAAVAIADLNTGDMLNLNDLVAANNSVNVSVRFSTGVGSFGPETLVQSGSNGAASVDVAVADVDGDGDVDLLVANVPTPGFNPTINILKNNGDGTFAMPVQNLLMNLLPALPKSIAAADVNADFYVDFVIVSDVNHIQTFVNDGGGAFSPSSNPIEIVDAVSMHVVTNVALSDLDGNGTPDAVVVFSGDSTTNGGVAVLLNRTPTGGGGGSDLDRLRIFMGTWGPEGGGTASDYNKDGMVDAVDLAVLLSNWSDPNNPLHVSSTVSWVIAHFGFDSVASYTAWLDVLTEQELFDHINAMLDLIAAP